MKQIAIAFFLLGALRLLGAGPGQAGLELLQGLGQPGGRSSVMEKLEISRFCGPRKEGVIKKHWEARADWVRDGRYTFDLLEETNDAELAAVLIGATSPDSPFMSQVISLALVRTGDTWKVAPVEGSFENTGLGFGAEIRERADNLEIWMARERVKWASTLQTAEWQKFRKTMEGAVPANELRELGPKEALKRFMNAAETGNANAAIVWQGFLEKDEFPQVDWERNLEVTRLGLQGKDQQRVWRLLTSRKVMKVIMDDEGDADDNPREILVGFLSSYETGIMNDNINPVRFQLKETSRGWRVNLPAFFAFADEDQRTFRNAGNRAFNWEDRTGVRRMFGVFEKEQDKIREDEAREVVDGLVVDLAKGDLNTFLRRHYRYVEEKKEEKPDDDDVELPQAQFRIQRGGNGPDQQRMKLYSEAIQWWNEALEDREESTAELSKIYLEEEVALAILSLPPSAETWKPRYLEVWLGREEDGWMILPGRERPLMQTYPEKQKEVVAKLGEQFSADEAKIYEEFLKKVLQVVGIDAGEGQPASEEKAFEVVRAWREIARNKGMIDLLKASAVRKLPEESKSLLKVLGYVRKGAAAASIPDQYLGSQSSGRFRAVSMMADRGLGDEMVCPLIIVVPVGEDFRVLVDVELPLETNKGISLMNLERMEEIEKEMSKEDFAHIQSLREWHQNTARPVWEKWKAEKEAE